MNNAKETKDKICFDTIDGATLMSTPHRKRTHRNKKDVSDQLARTPNPNK